MISFTYFYLPLSKLAILITDGKSQDNVQDPAEKLRNLGVKIFAVGENRDVF